MNMVYPNQKIVTVHKAPANSTNYYGILNKLAAQRASRELTQNEMRVYLYLTLNQTNFQMALSTSYISQNYGGSVDGLQAAIKGLIKKGYLVKEKGNHYHFYDDPEMANHVSEDSIQDDIRAEQENFKSENVDNFCNKPGDNSVEIIKKDYIENTKEYNDALLDSFPDEWDFVFKKIQVKKYAHSMKQLTEAVGYVPDVFVIKRIVDEHWMSFERKFDQQGGYRFRTLLSLVGQEYEKWKDVMALEEVEKQNRAWIESPLIDFGNTPRSNRRRSLAELEDMMFLEEAQEDVVDTDILDGLFSDYDDVI